MPGWLRRRQPGSPLWRIVGWYAIQLGCFVYMTLFHRYRAWGVRHIPDEGPVMLVSNHQSFFDPVIVGIASHKRQFYALARSTLFKNSAFRALIEFFNAIPVEQGESDLVAMRRSIDVLKKGHAFLIFPEGARTGDGKTGEFATGTMLVIKRAKPVVIPVAIEGAFDVWPRSAKGPRLSGRIGVEFGEPIAAEDLLEGGDAEAVLGGLRDRIEGMRLKLAERMGE